MSVSLSALDWIILIVASLSTLLLFFVFILIHRTRKQEFNDLWKTRHFLVLFAILSILGNLFTTNLWWAEKGLASISKNAQNYVCSVLLVVNRGICFPFFFLIILFMITLRKKQTEKELINPTKKTLLRSFIFLLPLLILHILISAINLGLIEKWNYLISSSDDSIKMCVKPVMSTLVYFVFYILFLIFYYFQVFKFGKTILNVKSLRRLYITSIALTTYVIGDMVLSFPDRSEIIALFDLLLLIIACYFGIYTFVLKPILDMRNFDRINMSEFDPLIADEQEESESSDINDLHSDVESDNSSEQSPKLKIETKNHINDVETDPFSSSEEEDKKEKKEHKGKKDKDKKNKDKHKIPSKKKKTTKNLSSDKDIIDTGITPKKFKSKKSNKKSNQKKHSKNKKAIIQDSESESEKSSSSSVKLKIKTQNQIDDDDDSDPFADFSD